MRTRARNERGASAGALVLGVVVAIVAAWLLFGMLGGIVRWIFTLIGYVVVAFLAFWVGRATAGIGSDDE